MNAISKNWIKAIFDIINYTSVYEEKEEIAQ